MKSFDENRIKKTTIKIPYDLELIIIEPKKETSKICLFISGLNGDKSSIKYFDNKTFDDKYLITFNHRQWGDNKAKSSKNYNVYIEDIFNVIKQLNVLYPNKEIYLIGESFGSSLSIIFYNKYPQLISGVFVWNMPGGAKGNDLDKQEGQFLTSIKILMTFLFNINFKSPSFFPEQLTNNKILYRAIKIQNMKKEGDNKVIIASWYALKKAWKTLYEILENKQHLNLVYIQSLEDALMGKSKIKRLENKFPNLKNNKYYIFEKGTHILSFDMNEANHLFELMDSFIMK